VIKLDTEKIGKFIYNQRKKLNLTQSELAEKLSVTSQAISKWERGKGIPDIEMLNELSKIFNVDIKDIINGEELQKEEKTNTIKPHKFKKKHIIIGIIILILILVSVLLIIIPKEQENNFNFHSLTSNNSCFGVKGVIAYNKNKKSIYISNIECSNEDKKEYLDLECILYETIDNTEKKIYEYGKIKDYNTYDKNNFKTLNELLSSVEFNIDDYTCSCNSESCNNLYIRINAINIDNEVITYNIPIELENKCIN